MYNTTLAKQNSNRINHYLVKEILEATPQQLLIKIYDFAILNCQRKNLAKTNSALQELINSIKMGWRRCCRNFCRIAKSISILPG